MAAEPVSPPRPPSVVREYMSEVQRLDQSARIKKKFRNVEGFPFWPHEFVRDMVFLCFGTALFFGLSGFIPYYLESPANPAGQPQVILPDWYLLWSYGLLKIAQPITPFCGLDQEGCTVFINAKVVGVLLNGVVIAPLLILPFIHPGHSRRPVEEPFWGGVGAFGIMLAFTLSAFSVNGVYRPKLPWLATIKFAFWELDAWLTVLLPLVAFFLVYIPLKWRKSILGYENKLNRNYFRIR